MPDFVLQNAGDTLQAIEESVQSWAKDSDSILMNLKKTLYKEVDSFVSQMAMQVQEQIDKKCIFVFIRTDGLPAARQAPHT